MCIPESVCEGLFSVSISDVLFHCLRIQESKIEKWKEPEDVKDWKNRHNTSTHISNVYSFFTFLICYEKYNTFAVTSPWIHNSKIFSFVFSNRFILCSNSVLSVDSVGYFFAPLLSPFVRSMRNLNITIVIIYK